MNDGIRTRDNWNHNPGLYQLSYIHHKVYHNLQANGAPGRIRTCDHLLRRQMLYPTELQALNQCFRTNKKSPKAYKMVGAEGFEPPTLCSQSRCATKLRYAPIHSTLQFLVHCVVVVRMILTFALGVKH